MRKKGFTLVELLVVVALVGSLGGVFLTQFPASQKRTRDTQRSNDLKQFQTALEAYANRNTGLYPIFVTMDADGLCPTLGSVGCSKDPRSDKGHESYKYQSDAGGLNFVLWARFEIDDIYFIICSDGDVGELASPIVVNDGVCPL